MKNAVHVLPNNRESREDFEWLRAEVAGSGGEANVFAASTIKGVDERLLRARFRKTKAAKRARRPSMPSPSSREGGTSESSDPREFRRRFWVTRPRPGVDRFASAWLIRRFIDRSARFVFASAPDKFPDAVPFDMYQPGGFGHRGNRCTFEVLAHSFGIDEPAVKRIAEIVHDVDLKDDRYRSPHAGSVAALVDGLRGSIGDDTKLLEQGIVMFEALYQSLAARRARV